MRILFLDIDGVLNSEASFRWNHYMGNDTWDHWCPILSNNLRVLIANLPEDVKIVISSCWRLGRTVDELKAIFKDKQVDYSRIIGKTPSLDHAHRGDEIGKWLSARPDVTDLVIVDDDSDMGDYIRKHVKTDFKVGLTLYNVSDILNRFGVKF